MKKAILYKILLCFVSAQLIGLQSNAQLHKDWGIYLTDSTLNSANQYPYYYGMQCDAADNIYVQYTDPKSELNTLSIACLTKNGEVKWKREYAKKGPDWIYPIFSFLYKWEDRIIALQPVVYDDSAFIYEFNEINPFDGSISNQWIIPSPPGISMHGPTPSNGVANSNGLMNDRGQVFMSGYYFQNANVMNMVRFDLPSQSSKVTSFECLEGTYRVNSPSCHIININDSLFAFSSPTRLENWNTGVQINVVKKEDLSFFSVINSNENIAMINAVSYGNKVLLNGGTMFELDLKDKSMRRIGGNGARSIEQDRWGNIYLNPYSEPKLISINNNLVDTSWTHTFESPDPYIRYGEIEMMTKKNIYTTYPLSRFIRKGDFGDEYYSFGLTTAMLNNQGEVLDTHTELFDTSATNNRIEPYAYSTTDSKDNIIRLVPEVKRNDSLYNRSFYLYKLCIDCDDNNFEPSPIVDRFTNYIQVIENPARNNLNYKFGIVTKDRLSFSIVNAACQQVYEKKYDRFQKGEYQQTIDVSSLTHGVYFLRMSTAYESYTAKFIVTPR